MAKIPTILNLIDSAKFYKKSKMIDKVKTDHGVICLTSGCSEKLTVACSSLEHSEEDRCPYCTEAIPKATLGKLEDWIFVGNKYASTDFEVSLVSKDHVTHSTVDDLRVWMIAVVNTNACLLYSPVRKSLPFHKHVQLLHIPDAILFKIPKQWIEKNVGIVQDQYRKAVVISGNFEFRLQKTIHIVSQLYSRGHSYNMAITPTEVYIMPSTERNIILGGRVFLGVISTENRRYFEYMKKDIKDRDSSFIIPDLTKYHYSSKELRGLTVIKESYDLTQLKGLLLRILNFQIDLTKVLFFEKELATISIAVANALGIECELHVPTFVTDKKGYVYFSNMLTKTKSTSIGGVLIFVKHFDKSLFVLLRESIKKGYATKALVVMRNEFKTFELKSIDLITSWDEFKVSSSLVIGPGGMYE